MIREKQQTSGPVIIDLTGPDGNAFVLLGKVESFGKQLKWTSGKIKSLQQDMMSADYEHLLEKFDEAFGDFVILER